MAKEVEQEFPCTLTLRIPLPSPHLAETALKALSVDQELSPLVRRSFALTTAQSSSEAGLPETSKNVLEVRYAATTNRMLRVAVNGFFESLGVLLGVMRDLDVDVVEGEGRESLQGVQGLVSG